jgi:hypothetical protein
MSRFEHPNDTRPWEAAPGADPTDWELAAAAVDLAFLDRAGSPLAALPAELAGRIGRDAAAHPEHFDPRAPEARPKPVGRGAGTASDQRTGRLAAGDRPWLAAAGWWTAACLAGLLLWQWSGLPRPVTPPEDLAPTPSLVELRGSLLAEDPQAVMVAWKKASDDPAVVAGPADLERAGGLGDVVWSAARQEGFMRFQGLAANDPAVAQYQLWIFDAERNDAYPVDGGVFDVPPDAGGDIVVRIDPRLPVSRATAFAVTVEQPGGVVVSSRERLPLLAALP